MEAGQDSRNDRPEPSREASPLGTQLEGFRPRLRQMVSLRLDPRLRRRVDSSDVIQEAFVDATRRIEEYRAAPAMSFFVWVRLLTAQKLMEVHRRHLGAEKRDVRREVAGLEYPEATSVSLARALLKTPSEELARKEQEEHLREALESLSDVDREILMLRHFEGLSNAECAGVLGLSEPGAYLRHVRAAKRLREVLRAHPDLSEDLLLGGEGTGA